MGANKTIESLFAGISVFRVQFRLTQISARASRQARVKMTAEMKGPKHIDAQEHKLYYYYWAHHWLITLKGIEIISKDFKKMTKIKSGEHSYVLNRFYFEAKLARNFNDIVPFVFSKNLNRQENVFVLKCLFKVKCTMTMSNYQFRQIGWTECVRLYEQLTFTSPPTMAWSY